MKTFTDGMKLEALFVIDKLIEKLLVGGMPVIVAFQLRNDMVVWLNGHAQSQYGSNLANIDDAYAILAGASGNFENLGVFDDITFTISCTFYSYPVGECSPREYPRIVLDCKDGVMHVVTRMDDNPNRMED